MNRLLSVLTIFQRKLGVLWRAFLHPATPFYLKAIMVGVVVYLISPIDLVPDFFAVIGWVDDILLITFAVNWIMKRLPENTADQHNPTHRAYRGEFNDSDFSDDYSGPVINGKARRN